MQHSLQHPRTLLSWLPFLVSALILILLTCAFPYAEGTGAVRQPIGSYLYYFWQTEQWQHCWLVLPALAFIVYSQRASLREIPRKGDTVGLLILLAGFAIYWVGYRVGNYFFGYMALQLLVAGFILWFAGWRCMVALSFPFFFMGFLWPLHFLEASITFPLRGIMSKASVFVLNFVGIPVILQGTGILSAPDPLTGLRPGQRFSVDVADPCSGIRSLFALMMVSALYGFFTMKKWWQKWVLFLFSIPLAILGNLCRILMLTFGTMAMGPAVAIGTLENPSFFHMAAGYVVFAVALGGMIGIGWLLQSLPNFVETFQRVRSKQVADLDRSRSSKEGIEAKKAKNKVDPY